VDEVAEACEQARRYARQHPVTQATISVARYRPAIFQPYCFHVTERYHIMLVYETFPQPELGWLPPTWHAQFAILEPISTLEFGAVQLALVAVKDWMSEDVKAVTELFADVLGPVLKHHDSDVHVHDGLWDRHFFCHAEPDEETTN
jgi:hypothetical protein